MNVNFKMFARFVLSPLLAPAIFFNPAFAQEPVRELTAPGRVAAADASIVPPRTSPCPEPIHVTLTATATTPPYVFAGDFLPGQLANHVGLGYTGTDRQALYTFQWKRPHECCQITSAMLTITLKANQGGISTNSPDAGNDNVAIMHNGSVVPPYNERIYTGNWPFSAGKMITKNWTLYGAALANLNADGRVSIAVEDDTEFQSATLVLTGCCLTR